MKYRLEPLAFAMPSIRSPDTRPVEMPANDSVDIYTRRRRTRLCVSRDRVTVQRGGASAFVTIWTKSSTACGNGFLRKWQPIITGQIDVAAALSRHYLNYITSSRWIFRRRRRVNYGARIVPVSRSLARIRDSRRDGRRFFSVEMRSAGRLGSRIENKSGRASANASFNDDKWIPRSVHRPMISCSTTREGGKNGCTRRYLSG